MSCPLKVSVFLQPIGREVPHTPASSSGLLSVCGSTDAPRAGFFQLLRSLSSALAVPGTLLHLGLKSKGTSESSAAPFAHRCWVL